ncbi:MAG TPA: hypothetical protein VHC90_21015 [Bryobacteraceae bacterium]|nr:hypothetical protein [Bryobacteraceae bacterium]
MTRERVAAGMDYARSNGTKSGGTIGRPASSSLVIRSATPQRRQSWRQIAARLHASPSDVLRAFHRYVKRLLHRMEKRMPLEDAANGDTYSATK